MIEEGRSLSLAMAKPSVIDLPRSVGKAIVTVQSP